MTINNIQLEGKFTEHVPRVEPERRSPAPIEIKKNISPAKDADVKDTDLETAVNELNNFADNHDINLSFRVDKSTGKTVIKIMDAQTEEVVRQYPPEEILDMAASLKDLASNFFNVFA
jgi:flagellar protein FlaG